MFVPRMWMTLQRSISVTHLMPGKLAGDDTSMQEDSTLKSFNDLYVSDRQLG